MRRLMVAAVLAGLIAVSARAEDTPAPVVRAQLFLPLPSKPVIAIEPRDDSDDNLKLRDLMEARLVEQNIAVAADAPLVLRFSSAVISGRDTPRDGPGNRKGIFGGGRAPPNAVPRDTPVSYRLSATLEQRAGTVLWKADVTAPLGDQDELDLASRLATTLIDNVGRSIDARQPAR